MRVSKWEPAEVQRNWPWLAQLLKPAVDLEEGHRSLDTVRDMILSGEMGIASIHTEKAAGVIVIHPGIFDGLFCLWIPYFAGEVRQRPREWVRTARLVFDLFTEQARLAGCAEARTGGRDWTLATPGWLPLAGVTNGRRKVL